MSKLLSNPAIIAALGILVGTGVGLTVAGGRFFVVFLRVCAAAAKPPSFRHSSVTVASSPVQRRRLTFASYRYRLSSRPQATRCIQEIGRAHV